MIVIVARKRMYTLEKKPLVRAQPGKESTMAKYSPPTSAISMVPKRKTKRTLALGYNWFYSVNYVVSSSGVFYWFTIVCKHLICVLQFKTYATGDLRPSFPPPFSPMSVTGINSFWISHGHIISIFTLRTEGCECHIWTMRIQLDYSLVTKYCLKLWSLHSGCVLVRKMLQHLQHYILMSKVIPLNFNFVIFKVSSNTPPQKTANSPLPQP